jgi:transposase InsO family protein
MNDSRLGSITEIAEFLKSSDTLSFTGTSKQEQYEWVGKTLTRFRYFSLRKKDKSIVKAYLMKMTGRSDAQMTRLIKRKKVFGIVIPSSTARHAFPVKYTPEDIGLLVMTDNAHHRLSGPATKRIFQREYETFGKQAYVRLKDISVSHLYCLRGKRQYTSASLTYTKTQATQVSIGMRMKPDPNGIPGFIRVDSVHQGDLGGEKGVYHINLVDEVLQWEIVGATEKISESYLLPVLESLLEQFPFRVINFHSDNGSEYINKVVADLLNKLLISQTKSRSRHCNDQALVESKNGSVIRKHMGRMHISQKHARPINLFYKSCFNLYLNYHRPCGFATSTIDRKGKEKKRYDTYRTPYERLLSLDTPEQYLREGVTLAMLEEIAMEKSDNEYAAFMQKEKSKLFQSFIKQVPVGQLI